jgi:hypothetical protein
MMSFSALASMTLAGSKILQLEFLFFELDVYHVSLFVPHDQKQKLPVWQNINELKLEFNYLRDVEKKYLEQAWSESLSSKFDVEKKLIMTATPPMKKKESLVMLKKGEVFIMMKNEQILIEIKNKDFVHEVMGIWLDKNGKFPKVAHVLTNSLSGDEL